MITKIEGLPGNVIGFEAVGSVNKHDYVEVVFPAMKAFVEKNNKLRFLYVVTTGLDHYTVGAMWDDIKLGFQHFNQWYKIAIVTDKKLIETMTKFFSFAVPAHVKVFHSDQLAAATHWVSEQEAEPT